MDTGIVRCALVAMLLMIVGVAMAQEKPAEASAADAPPVQAKPAADKPAAEKSAADKPTGDKVAGTPPSDHPFAKIKAGMSFADATAILGKPTAENAFCTGKQYIPFYFGKDKGRTNYYYKGQGTVSFYTDVSTFGIGRYVSCTAKTPTEVSEVVYDPNEPGVVPKDDGEAKK